MTPSVLVALLAVVVPATLVGGGAWFAVRGRRIRSEAAAFVRTARRTSALVTGLEQVRHAYSPDRGVSWTYHPLLRFTADDGREVEATSPWGSTPAPARPGQTVDVLYDPAQPERVQVAGRPAGGCLGPVFVAVGLGLVLFGLGAAFVLLFVFTALH